LIAFPPAFAPTFAATLLGVFVAFILARVWDFHAERRAASTYLQNIRRELLVCVSLLEPKEGNLLPTHNWDSLVASGQLKLLKHEIVSELGDTYSRIKNSNYEAQICRRAGDDVPRMSTLEAQAALRQHWQNLTSELCEREDNLRKDLQSILNRPWWPN